MDQRELDVEGMLRTSPDIASRFVRSKVEAGDLVYALRGKLGEVRKVPFEVAGANLTQGTARIAPRSEISSDYLMWAMRGFDAIRQASYQAKGSTFVEITLENLRNIQIAVPAPLEQTAIAKALSDVDALIAGLEKLIAKKRDLKQAAMQQLLTGQTRLPGFSGEWARNDLKYLVSTPITDGPHLTPTFYETGVPFLSVNNLANNRIDLSELRFISKTDDEIFSKKCKPRKGDVLLGKAASVGKVAIVEDDFDFNIWSPIALIRTSDQVHAKFLYYQLLSADCNTQVMLLTNSSSQGNIGMGDIEKIQILYPCLEEQTAIAKVLFDMDAELTVLESRITKTRDLKQGMMQELLTGRTRLVSKSEI
jgi:type I restriction enzyme S subunit